MNSRFVLDESSWRSVAKATVDSASAIDSLLDRVATATDRGEGVSRHQDFYETDVGENLRLFSLLFQADCEVSIDRDRGERLRLALDRAHVFSDEELEAYDAVVDGAARFAPGICWAHWRCATAKLVAVLPLAIDQDSTGLKAVYVNGNRRDIHFVTSEAEHRGFFRHTIAAENVTEDALPRIVGSAFPDLLWADDVWIGLRRHRQHFFGEHRAVLIRHLAVLDDEGARLFSASPGGQGVSEQLGARGVNASTESGSVRGHGPSIRSRRGRYGGVEYVFWWHTKIRWDVGRIHFIHLPGGAGDTGRLLIGIFTDHCVLPN